MRSHRLSSRTCHLLYGFECPPEFNMALDARMLGVLRAGSVECLWRVYSWSPAAISVGRNQDVGKTLDMELVARRNVPVVRRPTGGRAIYHSGDVCVSLAALKAPDVDAPRQNQEIYRQFAGILIRLFEKHRVKVTLARGERGVRSGTSGIKLPCFLSATPYELMTAGRKIAGVALYVGSKGFLVQSSLRLRSYRREDFQWFAGLGESASAVETITSLEAETGRSSPVSEIRDSLAEVLREEFGDRVDSLEAVPGRVPTMLDGVERWPA